MLSTVDVSLVFGSRKLFTNVSLKFIPGNCYGVIGANGAGKSTFLKILAGEIEPTSGQVILSANETMSVLKQDHFRYSEEEVLQTVIMGNEKLIAVTQAKDELYAKPDFSDEDGILAAQLEVAFADMDGWEAEANAATLLSGLGLAEEHFNKKVKQLNDDEKVKVLLAQALFGKPNVLLLDEPTNHLDAKAIFWLENFLLNFNNTVIVVSHDRYFLNKICTHMVDIDYAKAQVYVGNYDFWVQSSQLAMMLRANENKKKEDKAKDLEAFIRRFSANASKSKQATSRKKQLEKLTLEDMPTSSRKSPYVCFNQLREAGDIMLEVKNLSKSVGGVRVLNQISFQMQKGDKAVFIGQSELAKTTLLQILAGELAPDEGSFRWGVTTTQSYLPKDHNSFFENRDIDLIEWLSQFSEDKSESFLRGFLGRMLFTGDETRKKARVLSGGEKVRCMLSRMMLGGSNVLIFDGPTNHLDLESITALNAGLIQFQGTLLFASHDQEFVETIANHLFEITPRGIIDHQISYQEYLEH